MPAVIQTVLILILLIYDSVRDIKYCEIPNEISAAVALAMVLDFNVQNLWGLAAAAVFFIAALFTGKIGGGDVTAISHRKCTKIKSKSCIYGF